MLRAPEFKPLLEFLKARQRETLERLVDAQDKDQMVRLQGRSIELKEILELVDQGEVLLTKIRSR
jgi:flagellar motor switch protein FliM